MKRTTEKLYGEHQNLIFSVAHQVQAGLRVDKGVDVEYEELVSQGNLVFCEASKSFKSDKGTKYSSWLCNMLLQKLYAFGVTQSTLSTYPKSITGVDWAVIEDKEPSGIPPIEAGAEFGLKVKGMSRDAQLIAKLFTELPVEAIGLQGPAPPRKVRGHLRLYLRTMGWSYPRINRTIRELKTAFTNGGN